jgi:hypothetical protein
MTWKKGQSGNPAGSPKREDCLTTYLREYIKGADGKDRKKRYRKFVEKVYAQAMEGDRVSQKYIWDRIGGRPSETHIIDTDDGGKFEFIIKREETDTGKSE